VPARFRDEQRLAFGRVAKLYDRVRPSYPDAVIDAVLAFAGLRPGARILEIGAGTGKATMLLAERGERLGELVGLAGGGRRCACALQDAGGAGIRSAVGRLHASKRSAARWSWL